MSQTATPAEIWTEIENASRVYVVEPDGTKKWKTPSQISADDKVLLKTGGKPITMDGEPGRPRKPDADDDGDGEVVTHEQQQEQAVGALIAEDAEKLKRQMKRDPLLKIARKNPDASQFMDLVMRELAEEVAVQKFERQKLQSKGQPVSEASSRRVRALEKLGDQWLRRQERLKQVGVVDLNSPAMQEFFKCFVETLGGVMDDLRFKSEDKEALMNKLSGSINDEWKLMARKRMKNAVE